MFSLATPLGIGDGDLMNERTQIGQGIPLDLDTHEGFGNGLCNCPQSFVPEEKMSRDV